MAISTPAAADKGERLAGHLAMLLFAALIAGSFSLGKLALPYIGPAPLNGLRFVLGTLVMGTVAFGAMGNRLALPAAPWRFAITGGLTAVYFVSMFIALKMTTPVSTSAIFTLLPLMSAFFGWLLLKQVLRPVMALSLVLAGLGSIWVIFKGSPAAIAGFDLGPGEAVYFVGCFAYSIYAPLLRKFSRGEPVAVLSFFTLAATAVWIVLYGLKDILATDWLHLPGIVWIALCYLAVFSTAVSFFLVQFASLRLPASKVMAYGYLTPVFVIVYEGLSGHGWVTASVAMGALVICGGLVVLYFAPET